MKRSLAKYNEWTSIFPTLLARQNITSAKARMLHYWEMYSLPAVCLRQSFLVLIVDVLQHCVAVSRLMCCHIALHGEQGRAFSYKSFLIFPSPSEAFPSLFDLSFWCMYSTRWPDANAMGMVQIKMIIWKWPKFSNNWQFPTPHVPECCETIHPCRGQYLRVSS